MPLSESRELADRPETEETEEAVETERSSCGTALRASEGETHGSGERQRSGGGEGVDSMARCGRCGGCAGCRAQAADVVQLSSGCWCSAGAGKSATGHVRNPWAKELVVGALQWLLGGGSGDWFQRLSQ